jgi:hypothetical protein
MVDARGRDATRIALIQTVIDEESNSDNATDHCTVSALTWEASDRLWAAGDFGLISFSRVVSPVTAS